jgi:hypothetical protein
MDEKYRTIEVKVLRPSLTVTAKKGYYPAASDARPVPPRPQTGASQPAAAPAK